MTLKILAMALTFFAGVGIAFQPPVNAKLSEYAGGSLVAAFCSFLVGTLVLGAFLIVTNQFPDIERIQKTEPWMWLGGFLGAFLVFVKIFSVPILGAALLISLLISGQIITGLFIDNAGFLLPEIRSITWIRILGLCFVIIGVTIFAKF